MNRPLALLLATFSIAGCSSAPEPRTDTPPQIGAPSPVEWSGARNDQPARGIGDQLADFALRLLGTPYRFGGATRAGFDCSGLVFYTHQQLGLTVPRTSRLQAEQAEEVKERKLERGDLVFFRIENRRVNHVGIYVGERRFVHAPRSGRPVTVNSLDDDFYAEYFSSAGRFWKPD